MFLKKDTFQQPILLVGTYWTANQKMGSVASGTSLLQGKVSYRIVKPTQLPECNPDMEKLPSWSSGKSITSSNKINDSYGKPEITFHKKKILNYPVWQMRETHKANWEHMVPHYKKLKWREQENDRR